MLRLHRMIGLKISECQRPHSLCLVPVEQRLAFTLWFLATGTDFVRLVISLVCLLCVC